ncbi:MAG: glycosyltransferase family 4 protein [Kiritimatiellae bacterium]|nr:glycosyltransferase family 4 protein [Kiritimatiellia bacterium]
MKILFTSPSLSVQADAPLNSKNRAEALQKTGAQVVLLGFPEIYPLPNVQLPFPYISLEKRASSSTLRRWEKMRKYFGIWWTFLAVSFLVKLAAYRIARKEKFDLICMHHAEPCVLLPLVAWLRLIRRYTPTVVILPMAFIEVGAKNITRARSRLRGILNAYAARRLAGLAHIVIENRHYAEGLRLTRKNNVHIIPEGYTNRMASFSLPEARRKLGIAPGQRMVLLFGTATVMKGADLLIKALEEVPPAFLVYIAGKTGGIYESSWGPLERLQNTGWKDNLRIVSRFIPEDEMELYFAAAHACIFPYRRGFSTISSNLRQAGEMGKAILASDQYHFTDIVKNYKVGLLFEPENVPEIARCLREFAAKPDEWFAEIRRNSEILVKERSWEKIAAQYLALFQHILDHEKTGQKH